MLSSFRPGGFEARALDERTANRHGLIGQETQGVGGFFMALRAIEVMKGVAADIEAVCPEAKVFNYTNPVNVVAQAWTTNTDIPLVSLCEGPIIFTEEIAEAAGLDATRVASTMVGLNHACWSVEHTYDGEDLIPYLRDAAAERLGPDSGLALPEQRILRLAVAMDAIPADYFQYYYWRDEILAEQRAKPTTRAEDILSWVPGYWEHYAAQAETDDPVLDPDRSRGGINELELAIDAMHAVFNDTGDVLPVNVPNRGSLPGFPDDLVVEITGRCSAAWIEPLPQRGLPLHLRGLVEMLAEYQLLAAAAAWSRNPGGCDSRPCSEPARPVGRQGGGGVRRVVDRPPCLPRGATALLMDVVLGVDGGNTKTLALVARTDGAVIGVGRAGCADIHRAADPESAIAEIEAAVNAAFGCSHGDPEDRRCGVRSCRCRLAGGLRVSRVCAWGRRFRPRRCSSSMTPSGFFAAVRRRGLAWPSQSEPTPRSAAGMQLETPSTEGGGQTQWAGSRIAEAALSAVYRADLGLGPATTLTARVCDAFAADSADDLLYILNRRGAPANRPGQRLTPIVLEEAEAGDVVAADHRPSPGRADRYGGPDLGRARRAGGDDTLLVLGGGVFRHPVLGSRRRDRRRRPAYRA